jgi:DNA-binding NarL/FixJ family response regulator
MEHSDNGETEHEIVQFILTILRRQIADIVKMEHDITKPEMSHSPNDRVAFDKLTARECEVLTLICQGLSNKAAGERLSISPRTVEVHRGRVMEKLRAKNMAELMRIVMAASQDHGGFTGAAIRSTFAQEGIVRRGR